MSDRFKSLTGDEGYAALRANGGMMARSEFMSFTPRLGRVAALVQLWQTTTFGPPESRTGCTARLEHIRREVDEASYASKRADYFVDMKPKAGREADFEDGMHETRDALASELADIGILLLSACAEAGMDLAVIMYRKLLENRERTWSKPDADGVIEHVKPTTCVFLTDHEQWPDPPASAWLVVHGTTVVKNREGECGAITQSDVDTLRRLSSEGVETIEAIGLAASYAVGHLKRSKP